MSDLNKTRFGAACIFITWLAASPGLWAQGEIVAARLAGTVLDPDGAAVPQAKVTLSSPETGVTRTFLSSAGGTYMFMLFPPGRYQLKVEKEGFAVYTQSDIVLSVSQSTNLNPRLQFASYNYTVEVTAAPPLMNSGNANIGSEVSAKQVVELPLNIRNVYNLALLSSDANNSIELQGLT